MANSSLKNKPVEFRILYGSVWGFHFVFRLVGYVFGVGAGVAFTWPPVAVSFVYPKRCPYCALFVKEVEAAWTLTGFDPKTGTYGQSICHSDCLEAETKRAAAANKLAMAEVKKKKKS